MSTFYWKNSFYLLGRPMDKSQIRKKYAVVYIISIADDVQLGAKTAEASPGLEARAG